MLNALLNEERAIVSDIAGTTRDTIEDEIVLGGVSFRFIDTAGIRETSDTIESLGIERTYEKMQQARLVLLLLDAKASLEPRYVESQIEKLTGEKTEYNVYAPMLADKDQGQAFLKKLGKLNCDW